VNAEDLIYAADVLRRAAPSSPNGVHPGDSHRRRESLLRVALRLEAEALADRAVAAYMERPVEERLRTTPSLMDCMLDGLEGQGGICFVQVDGQAGPVACLLDAGHEGPHGWDPAYDPGPVGQPWKLADVPLPKTSLGPGDELKVEVQVQVDGETDYVAPTDPKGKTTLTRTFTAEGPRTVVKSTWDERARTVDPKNEPEPGWHPED
jgi:hypothetical protein